MNFLSKRFLWADIVRIVAIFLVVQIHAVSAYPDWLYSFILKLNATSIPLFILLSGSLLLGKRENYQRFFRKRIIKVLIPWVIWTFIYLIYFLYFKHDDQYTNEIISRPGELSNTFFSLFMSGLWFLPLIFSLYIITPALRILVVKASDIDIIYIFVFWFAVFSFLPYFLSNSLFPAWSPSLALTTFQYSGYFLIGYFLVKKNLKLNKYFRFIFFLILMIIFILPIPLKGYLDPAVGISSIIFFILLISFSNQIEGKIRKKMKYFISVVSGASLGIYLVHQLVIYELTKYKEVLIDYRIISGIIVFFLSCAIILIFQKIPIVKHIVP